MDENEQELQELDLEEIIKEFGTPADGDVPEDDEQLYAEAPEEVEPAGDDVEAGAAAEDEEEDTRQAPPEQVNMADTIRLEAITDIPEQPDTGKPVPGKRISEAEDRRDAGRQAAEDGAPTEEYVLSEPITFRPRSHLQELKRQLIAGPEKRYYEIAEQGVGKLQAAIFLSLLVVFLSAATTVLYAMGKVPETRFRLVVFSQFFAMLVSALLGSFQLIEGISDLFHKRFSLNTLLLITFVACCADGVIGLRELRVPCCAAFSLEMLMSLWSAYHKRITEQGQMDTMRKAVRLDSLVRVREYYGGQSGILRAEGQVADFMNTYNAVSKPEKLQNIYALIAFAVSVIAGVAAGVLHGEIFGVQVFTVSLFAAVPATAFITMSRPMAVLERRLHALGTVLCGWQGVEALSGKVIFPLRHDDLFPAGSIMMNGVKFYGDRDTDQVVAYSTALIVADGGGLSPLFTQLLESRNGRHYKVENLNTYGNGGIGGEVNGEPVIVGVLSFMKEMGVEVPEGTRVDQAVYVAIDGELSGLFALTYSKVRSAAAGLTTLCAYRDLSPVLMTGDFVLTDSFIRTRFGVNTRRIGFPERKVREELAAVKPEPDAPALALMTEEGLAPIAFAVTGARALRTASNLGVIVHILGGALGLVMMAVLAVLGRGDLLTPANLFLYQLIWMIPGLLITEWTRSV